MDTFVTLPEDQRAWLWHRYIQLYPKADTDADAIRAVCAQFEWPYDTGKAKLRNWREYAQFRAAEEQLRLGLSPDQIREVILEFAAANAIAAVIEQGKLIGKPWDRVNQREAGAKSVAINQAIKMFLDRQPARADKPQSIRDVFAGNDELIRDNLGGDDAAEAGQEPEGD